MKERLAGFLLLSVLLHGLLLAAPMARRGGGRMAVPLPLEVRLQDARRGDFSMPDLGAMAYFASLPASLPEMVAHDRQAEPARDTGAVDEYFIAADVDEQPQPMREVRPSYPAHAVAHDIEGWVRLLLLIDETGQVRHLEVIDARPPGIFDEAALNAFRLLPYTPAKRAGLPVKSRLTIRVDFRGE